MKNRSMLSALGMISAVIVPDAELLAHQSHPPDLTPDRQVVYSCPFFDIASVADVRSQIDAVYERTISSNPDTSPLNAFVALASEGLPKYYVLTGNWHNLRSLRREYQVVLGHRSFYDPILKFHEALFEGDSGALREIAAHESLSVSESFLAPVFELPELAALYADLLEGGEGLEPAFERLSRAATARAEALAREPDGQQEGERPGDRERLSLAWLYFHLARIAAQVPGRHDAAAGYLRQGASLLSPPCQPRTLAYFRTLAAGRSPCEGEALDEAVDVYLCWLAEPLLAPRSE